MSEFSRERWMGTGQKSLDVAPRNRHLAASESDVVSVSVERECIGDSTDRTAQDVMYIIGDGESEQTKVDVALPVKVAIAQLCALSKILNPLEYELVYFAARRLQVTDLKWDRKERKMSDLAKQWNHQSLFVLPEDVKRLSRDRSLHNQGFHSDQHVLKLITRHRASFGGGTYRRSIRKEVERTAEDPVLLYKECSELFTNGAWPCTMEQAVEISSIQACVEHGNFYEDVKKCKKVLQSWLKPCLPKDYRKDKTVVSKAITRYTEQVAMAVIATKIQYIQCCKQLPTYKASFFVVKELVEKEKTLRECVLAISPTSVVKLHPTSREILHVWPLTNLIAMATAHGMIQLHFPNDEFLTMKTIDGETIEATLQFHLKKLVQKRHDEDETPRRRKGAPFPSKFIQRKAKNSDSLPGEPQASTKPRCGHVESRAGVTTLKGHLATAGCPSRQRYITNPACDAPMISPAPCTNQQGFGHKRNRGNTLSPQDGKAQYPVVVTAMTLLQPDRFHDNVMIQQTTNDHASALNLRQVTPARGKSSPKPCACQACVSGCTCNSTDTPNRSIPTISVVTAPDNLYARIAGDHDNDGEGDEVSPYVVTDAEYAASAHPRAKATSSSSDDESSSSYEVSDLEYHGGSVSSPPAGILRHKGYIRLAASFSDHDQQRNSMAVVGGSSSPSSLSEPVQSARARNVSGPSSVSNHESGSHYEVSDREYHASAIPSPLPPPKYHSSSPFQHLARFSVDSATTPRSPSPRPRADIVSSVQAIKELLEASDHSDDDGGSHFPGMAGDGIPRWTDDRFPPLVDEPLPPPPPDAFLLGDDMTESTQHAEIVEHISMTGSAANTAPALHPRSSPVTIPATNTNSTPRKNSCSPIAETLSQVAATTAMPRETALPYPNRPSTPGTRPVARLPRPAPPALPRPKHGRPARPKIARKPGKSLPLSQAECGATVPDTKPPAPKPSPRDTRMASTSPTNGRQSTSTKKLPPSNQLAPAVNGLSSPCNRTPSFGKNEGLDSGKVSLHRAGSTSDSDCDTEAQYDYVRDVVGIRLASLQGKSPGDDHMAMVVTSSDVPMVSSSGGSGNSGSDNHATQAVDGANRPDGAESAAEVQNTEPPSHGTVTANAEYKEICTGSMSANVYAQPDVTWDSTSRTSAVTMATGYAGDLSMYKAIATEGLSTNEYSRPDIGTPSQSTASTGRVVITTLPCSARSGTVYNKVDFPDDQQSALPSAMSQHPVQRTGKLVYTPVEVTTPESSRHSPGQSSAISELLRPSAARQRRLGVGAGQCSLPAPHQSADGGKTTSPSVAARPNRPEPCTGDRHSAHGPAEMYQCLTPDCTDASNYQILDAPKTSTDFNATAGCTPTTMASKQCNAAAGYFCLDIPSEIACYESLNEPNDAEITSTTTAASTSAIQSTTNTDITLNCSVSQSMPVANTKSTTLPYHPLDIPSDAADYQSLDPTNTATATSISRQTLPYHPLDIPADTAEYQSLNPTVATTANTMPNESKISSATLRYHPLDIPSDAADYQSLDPTNTTTAPSISNQANVSSATMRYHSLDVPSVAADYQSLNPTITTTASTMSNQPNSSAAFYQWQEDTKTAPTALCHYLEILPEPSLRMRPTLQLATVATCTTRTSHVSNHSTTRTSHVSNHSTDITASLPVVMATSQPFTGNSSRRLESSSYQMCSADKDSRSPANIQTSPPGRQSRFTGKARSSSSACSVSIPGSPTPPVSSRPIPVLSESSTPPACRQSNWTRRTPRTTDIARSPVALPTSQALDATPAAKEAVYEELLEPS